VTTYVFREFVPIKNSRKLDAQQVGEIIDALDADDKPDALWKAARDRKHYLHGCFEWDIRKAAEAHWRDTASALIRCVLVVEGNNAPVPAFISVSTKADGQRYVTPSEVVSNAALQLRMLQTAMRDLQAWARRYSMLRSVTPMIEGAARQLDDQITETMQQLAQGPPPKADAA